MTSYISKLGVSLVAFALVVAPTIGLAQTEPVTVSIISPSNNAQVTVGQTVTFDGSGVGGNSATYTYRWSNVDTTRPLVDVKSFTHQYNTVGTKNIELRITDGRGNTGTKSVTINVVSGTSQSDLVISNIRVESKTTNSAVIKWTTNRAATSRVIYDTVSRKNADGSAVGTKPNYNYAFSQPTSVNSSSPKTTEHSVTLTGLSANTKYFFRVLSAE